MKYLQLLILLICVLAFQTSGDIQLIEICDNAIDDDGDGLIDINDMDCFCQEAEAISLIPNPSFEDQNCCPSNRSMMDCADTWIQASAPTTDYIHTCGWMGWENLPMPLPIPDGEGAIGFRDGRYALPMGGNNNDVDTSPNWKEYAGACLTSPLRAGVAYKFEFYIGFTEQPFSPPINITFFGTRDCANLPFGNSDSAFGCPTNGTNWIKLGSVNTFGTNEWKKVEINVTPIADIHAIAIGPPCSQRSITVNPYYFFDNLVLAEQSAFEFDIVADNQPCAPNLSLRLPAYDSLTYQWYKDGIAIPGATLSNLDSPPGEGEYAVIFTSEEGCKVTKPFNFSIPIVSTALKQTICSGETLTFGKQLITTSGVYWDTLKNLNNCDSIIQLDLNVIGNIQVEIEAKIFPTENYKIGPFKFNQPGDYQQTISSSVGCDSTVNLTLAYYNVYFPNIFSPNEDGVNDYFTLMSDDDLSAILDFQIFDRWGNQVFQQIKLLSTDQHLGWNGKMGDIKSPQGVYLYTADLLMKDGVERRVSGVLTLVR